MTKLSGGTTKISDCYGQLQPHLDICTNIRSHGGERHPLIKRSLMDGWSAKQLDCELRGAHCLSSFGLQVK